MTTLGRTVQEAFVEGCAAVQDMTVQEIMDPADVDMEGKFLLLPHDGNHDVVIFPSRVDTQSNAKTGPIINVHHNLIQKHPSPKPPNVFYGRAIEMFYPLKAIQHKRFVSVIAEPGYGRSSIVCALCHYMNERASTIKFIERIVYVSINRFHSQRHGGFRALVKRLAKQLAVESPGNARDLPVPPTPKADMGAFYGFVCQALQDEKALIVLGPHGTP